MMNSRDQFRFRHRDNGYATTVLRVVCRNSAPVSTSAHLFRRCKPLELRLLAAGVRGVHFLRRRYELLAGSVPPQIPCSDLKNDALTAIAGRGHQDDAALVERALTRAGYDVLARRVDDRGGAAPRAARSRMGPGDRRLHDAGLQRHQGAGDRSRAASGSALHLRLRHDRRRHRRRGDADRRARLHHEGQPRAAGAGGRARAARGGGAPRAPPRQPARRLSRLSRLADRPAKPRVVPRSAAAGDPAIASR